MAETRRSIAARVSGGSEAWTGAFGGTNERQRTFRRAAVVLQEATPRGLLRSI